MIHAQALITWYQRHKRDLPWRLTQEPYPIWLSEIILQQTRVDQGMKYYHAFLEAYPTIHDLAAADEQEVLRLWQGLGYYSRARNLHAAAQTVVRDYNGTFPKSYQDILQLKGVGPYTAAAIASFAFGEATPVVDGNVQRVVSRLLALTEPVDVAAGKKAIQSVLDASIPTDTPGDFNQAMMELGATVCTPRNPACTACPLSTNCAAFATSSWHDFPIKKGKTKVKDLYLSCALIADQHGLVLRQRDDSSIWKNMFDLPTLESPQPMDLSSAVRIASEAWNLPTQKTWTEVERTRHILSHRRLHVTLYKVDLDGLTDSMPRAWKWVAWDELDAFPIPRLVERLLENWQTR